MSRHAFSFAVPPDHPSLAGHFPGKPIVPGVLLLDEALAALARASGQSLSRLQQVKFVAALLPGELAQGDWELEQARARFRISVRRGGAEVKIAEGAGLLEQAR
jgi:3-hydroxyacyl-[acyl-carrier-protein] dehydratase